MTRFHAPAMPCTTRSFSLRIVLILGLLTLFFTASAAQSPQRGEPADVVFRVINGTTGQPAVAQRILLQEHTMTMDEVADTRPATAVVTLRDVPLVDARAYIATVWFAEVPYYFEFRGRFLDQDTNQVHVFDTTTDVQGVAVSGLNLIFKKLDSLVTMETILEIENRTAPQSTVRGQTVEVRIPGGATGIEAVVRRGPSPVALRTTQLGTDRLALEVPLIPGTNRVQVKLKAEWRPDFTIPVGCSLPIEAWSLLASPETIDIISYELEPDSDTSLPGVQRFVGPALEAGRSIDIRVDAGTGPAPEGEIFAEEAGAETAAGSEAPAADGGGGRKVPLPLILLGAVLIILIVVVRRRRS